MATIKIYDQESSSTKKITFNIKNYVVTGTPELFMVIATNIRKPDGTAIDDYIVRNGNDVPPGKSPTVNLNTLCKYWIEYIIDQGTLGQSSSSSTSSSSSSSTSSSSSSSSTSESSSSSSSTSESSESSSSSSSTSLTSESSESSSSGV